jgi:hypothetical protein
VNLDNLTFTDSLLLLSHSTFSKYTFPDGSTYEGEWKENAPNGWGLFRWTDGSLYEGFWSKGCRHGNIGTLIVSDGFRYEGAWVDNAMEGRGVATVSDQ